MARPQNIETLPPEAQPAIRAAIAGIAQRRATTLTLHQKLNAELAALGLPRVSRSAFYRFARRVEDGDMPPRFADAIPRRAMGRSALPVEFERAIADMIDAKIDAALKARGQE